VCADASLATVQALVRWDPGWLAERELAERVALAFPPATRVAACTGTATAIAAFLAALRLDETLPSAELLGPVPVPATPGQPNAERVLLRVSRAEGAALATVLHAGLAARSMTKDGDPVRVQLDPRELL
jgi:primosomal protein N' (replication factor Y)